jgi:hypothetical protein
MNKHRIKLREDLAALKVLESLPYRIKSLNHRLSAYNSAKRLKITLRIREALDGDGLEVTRIR